MVLQATISSLHNDNTLRQIPQADQSIEGVVPPSFLQVSPREALNKSLL